MNTIDYLIIGGGMAADSAIVGIREYDSTGSIGLVSADSFPPYDRPPLSKGLWKGDSESDVWRKKRPGVQMYLERRVVKVDGESKVATDDQGDQYLFRKLLLTTGVRPRRLQGAGDSLIYYRSFEDYRKLRSLTETGQRFVVVGGGFIGSEIAASLAQIGKEVHLVFPGASIGANQYPAELSQFLNGYYRDRGVEVMPGATFESYVGKRASIAVDGSKVELEADGVIVGIGTEPNVELAEQLGLAVDNGIRVDSALRTTHSDIYAAGDVANYFDTALGEWRRVEHEDNANSMGKAAGQSMAGAPMLYEHLPFLYSDLFDLGYEAVGILDSRLETFTDWKEPNKEGVIYYLRNRRVVEVLLWNVWDQVDAARDLIKARAETSLQQLRGRLPR